MPNDGPLAVQYFVTAGIVALDGNRLIAVAGDEVIASDDAGCTWTSLAPIDHVQYVAGGGGQRAYTFGGYLPAQRIEGAIVTPIGADVFGEDGVQDLWVDPCDDAHLIALARRDGAILESTDAGDGWSEMAVCPVASVRKLAVDAGDTDHLACGTHEGVWMTRDGGEVWNRALGLASAEEMDPVDELEISGVDGEVVWAMQGGRENALFHSDDGGATFTKVVPVDVWSHVRADAVDARRVWFLSRRSLARYDLGGRTRVVVPAGAFGSSASAFAQSPADPGLMYLGLEHIIVD